MQNFVVDIGLASPIIMDRRFCGDSWLAGIAYGQHCDWQRAIAELPLANIAGVPQMSVVLPSHSKTRTEQSVTFCRSIMRDMMHDPDMATILDRMPPRSMLKPTQGPFSNIMNRYIFQDVDRLYFLGRGDIAAVQEIVRDVRFMGSQKARGFGEVVAVDVYPVATDNRWFGMIGVRADRNTVLRPIPTRLVDCFPPDLDYILNTETWRNPYWTGHATAVAEPCFTPVFQRGEAFTEADLEGDYARVIN